MLLNFTHLIWVILKYFIWKYWLAIVQRMDVIFTHNCLQIFFTFFYYFKFKKVFLSWQRESIRVRAMYIIIIKHLCLRTWKYKRINLRVIFFFFQSLPLYVLIQSTIIAKTTTLFIVSIVWGIRRCMAYGFESLFEPILIIYRKKTSKSQNWKGWMKEVRVRSPITLCCVVLF